MKPGIFLDRDGVITEIVFNSKTGEYEPAHDPADLVFRPGAIEALKLLCDLDVRMFLVSNQPDAAKGKTTIENLQAVHDKMLEKLTGSGIAFDEYYYCYHHPKGVVPEFTGNCDCRKPGIRFVTEAAEKYGINLKNSFMVGDRDSDIELAANTGMNSIMIKYELSSAYQGKSNPGYYAEDLKEAAGILTKALKTYR